MQRPQSVVAPKAIETRYAGCRFRSRLEARWATFFDALGVEWEYEPQGFVVPFGDRYADEHRGYLPDFWLPRAGIWAEVKGTLDGGQLALLVGATWDGEGLPRNPAGDHLNDDYETRGDGNPAGNRNGPRLLILGPIPDPASGHAHHVLCHHKGGIYVGHAYWRGNGTLVYDYLRDDQAIAWDSDERRPPRCDLTGTCLVRDGRPVRDAYAVARSARFEHGESG